MKVRLKVLIPLMLVVLATLVVLAMAAGAVYVPFADTVKIILKKWGVIRETAFKSGQEAIIYYVRFPRVVTAVLVGAALAVSGTVMQGMFRNPMADPGLLGISSGAGLGAVTAISLGLMAKSIVYVPLFAAVGAIAAAAVVFFLAARGGKVPTLTLILAGIAVSTFIHAVTSIVLMRMNNYQVKFYLFWAMGGFDDRRWEHVRMCLAPILIGAAALMAFSRDLNVMLMGEEEAQSVGLNPARTKRLLILFTSVTTAAAVSVSGNISFVGLIVPHILRLLVGPDHRVLLPASLVGGSIFLVACDLVARLVILPEEISVGIVTSLLGAPYFLYLLLKAKREGGAF